MLSNKQNISFCFKIMQMAYEEHEFYMNTYHMMIFILHIVLLTRCGEVGQDTYQLTHACQRPLWLFQGRTGPRPPELLVRAG